MEEADVFCPLIRPRPAWTRGIHRVALAPPAADLVGLPPWAFGASRMPTASPASSMNSIPAASIALRRASRLFAIGTRCAFMTRRVGASLRNYRDKGTIRSIKDGRYGKYDLCGRLPDERQESPTRLTSREHLQQ